jgi:hypothetical protein
MSFFQEDTEPSGNGQRLPGTPKVSGECAKVRRVTKAQSESQAP